MKSIMAIDPGVNGGIAWLDRYEAVQAIPMPSGEAAIVDELLRIIAGNKFHFCVIEDVGKGVMPGRAFSMISLRENAAVIRTALRCWNVPVKLVRPQVWQADLELGNRKQFGTDTKWKRHLKDEADRLFPYANVTLKTADALLLYEWGQR